MGISYLHIPGVGVPPSPLDIGIRQWRDNLIQYRLNEIPLTRSTTYYVSSSGDDLNPGTEPLPWRTRAKAITEVAASSGDVAVLFSVGDIWKESGSWTITKPNVTVGSYEPTSYPFPYPADKPIFSAFTLAYSSGWTLTSGDVYQRVEASFVEWIIYANDRLASPFSRQNSVVNCQANPKSFWYDSGTTTLYINAGVGIDPNTLSLEGVPRNSSMGVCLGAGANGGRIDNIKTFGYGLDSSSTGNNIVGIADQLKDLDTGLITNCESYYNTSHSIVHIVSGPGNSGGISTYAYCRAGYNIYNAAAETVFNSYSYEGDQETIFHECVAPYGTLPTSDWWTAGSGDQKRGILHYAHTNGGGGQVIGLIIFNACRYEDNPFGCINCGYAGNVPSMASDPADCRAYVFEELGPNPPNNNSIQWGGSVAYINCKFYCSRPNQTSQCYNATRPLYVYYLNCVIDIDLDFQTTTPFGLYNSTSTDNIMILYHCSIMVRNCDVTWAFDRDTYTGGTNSSPNGQMKNCLYQTSGGTGTKYVGLNNVAANQRYNAYARVSNPADIRGYTNDPAPVVLSSAIDPLPTGEEAYLVKFKGDPAVGLQYDINWNRRGALPSIGPIEFDGESSFRLNIRPWRGRV